MCDGLYDLKTRLESQDDSITIVYIVAGYPPEISGVSLGNEERFTWFNENTRNKLFIIAPDWNNVNKCVPETFEGRIFRYPSKPWLPYRSTRTARFWAKKIIEKKVSEINPDIIVITDAERLFLFSLWSMPSLKYAKRRDIPYIAHFHTDYYGFARRYLVWNTVKDILIKPIIKHIYKKVDHTICSTQAAQSTLENYGVKNAHYVPFVGVDNTILMRAPDATKLLSPYLWHDTAKKKILYLGRLAQEKRVDVLINAYYKLIDKYKLNNNDVELIITGEGPFEKGLQKLCSGEKTITFTGKLLGEDKFKMFLLCDVFCYPSPYETFGRSVIEAMISRTLVVVPSSGAMAEYIEDERNGFLFKANDVDACAESLNRALTCEPEKKEKILNNAYSSGRYFSIDKGCERLNNAYAEIIFKQKESRNKSIHKFF